MSRSRVSEQTSKSHRVASVAELLLVRVSPAVTNVSGSIALPGLTRRPIEIPPMPYVTFQCLYVDLPRCPPILQNLAAVVIPLIRDLYDCAVHRFSFQANTAA